MKIAARRKKINNVILNFLDQFFSLILPVTMLIIVPWSIEKNISIHDVPSFIIGLVLILAGLSIIVAAISLFIKIGKGTLAPWSPPGKLVIRGMYRYVRNPMISGVLITLAGESLAILSKNIFIWALAFFIINNIYFLLSEEPALERRFGKDYLEYKKNVPRWIPRLSPYTP